MPAPDLRAIRAEDDERDDRAGAGPQRVGFGRPVALDARDGHWYDLGKEGRLWIGDLVSEEAIALRLQLVGVDLPPGAELAVYAPGERRPAFRRTGPLTLARAWTPPIQGERARLELRLPARTAAAASETLGFVVDQVQHLYRDPLTPATAKATCKIDASCFSQWDLVGRSKAYIIYTDENGSFVIGGTLINSIKTDFSPLVLTAGDIRNADVAASVALTWGRFSTACGATTTTEIGVSTNSTLLTRSDRQNYALIRVVGVLPLYRPLTWAGWTAKRQKENTPVALLYHEASRTPLQLALGALERCSDCGRNEWVRARRIDGDVSYGGNGTGLFRDDAKQQLIGNWYTAVGTCDAPSSAMYAGALSSYYAKIKKHLTGTVDDKSEPNDSCARPRTIPRSSTLSGRVVKLVDEDWYRISVKPGQIVDVDLSFVNAHGDIDVEAYGACGGGPVAVSGSQDDGEHVSATNVGSKPAFLIWRVHLIDDVHATYDMTVSLH